ncbi:MAG: AsmA-like C-terminal region-containing protein, partial [Terriglobia bacterium]
PQFQAEAHLSGVSVQKLLEAFPASHGGITGQLEATLNLSGDAKPASKIWGGKQGEGTVTIRKGRLPKLQLNKSLLDFVRLAQLGPAKGDLAAFSSITADWHLEHGVISSRSVRIIGTGITVNGSGSSDLAGPGHLHYQGIAAVEARKNILTNVLAGMAGSELKDGKITLPFVLEGTFSNPIFRLNPNAQAGLPAVVSRPEKREQILKGVFKFFQNRKSQSRQ